MGKTSSPLTASDIRWLKAERRILANDIATLSGWRTEAVRRFEAIEERLRQVESTPSAEKTGSSFREHRSALLCAMRDLAAPYLWRLMIGVGVIVTFRFIAGHWPQQEHFLAVLEKMF